MADSTALPNFVFIYPDSLGADDLKRSGEIVASGEPFIPNGYHFDRVVNNLETLNMMPRTKATGQVH